jgi:hypothetical protein
MEPSVSERLMFDALCALRRALRELAEMRGAVQTLADRVEVLTTELAEGELGELRQLVARRLHPNRNGGTS